MGVHGSQGYVDHFQLRLLPLLLTTRGWPREGRGADESPSRSRWGLAAGCGRPSARGLVSDLRSTAADQSMAWGEGLLPHPVPGASSPSMEQKEGQTQPRLGLGSALPAAG